MKKSSLVIMGLVVILVGMLLFSAKKPTGNIVKEDIFKGIITNINLEPQILDGTGVYDRSCLAVENGLSQCDAGIQTEKGLLNLNYKHNMNMQGCIDAGQKLKVEVLADNKAIVTRT